MIGWMTPPTTTVLDELVADDGGGYSLCALEAPVRLSRDYVRRVVKLQAQPSNQSGADKSWVERAQTEWARHYASAELVD